jgi:peptidyl-prolyl cis-trans isomerase C
MMNPTSSSSLCRAALLALALGLGSDPAMAADANDPNAVVITVGEHKITASQFNKFVENLPQEYQEAARGPGRRAFAMNLAQLQLLADEAARTGLDKRPDLEAELAFQRINLLAQAMFKNLEDTATIPEAQVQAYFDSHKSDYETVTARHILILVKGGPVPAPPGKPELSDAAALAKANSIRKRINGGEDFATVAKKESDDTGSGANGGDLGTFKKGMMVPPFEAAAFSLKPGDISEPVKSQFGYHIIQVQAHSVKTLDEAKPDILSKMRPIAAQQAMATMAGNTKINLDDTYFGPAMKPSAEATPEPAAK